MPHWLLKSALHRAISFLPRPQFWNGVLQTYVTRSTSMTPAAFEEKLGQCRRFLQAWAQFAGGGSHFSVLEIGTGWAPTVPVGLYLCGADKSWTIDIDPLLEPARVTRMLQFFCDYERDGRLQQLLPGLLPDRMKQLREVGKDGRGASVTELLAALGVKVMVGDAQSTGIAAGSVDYIFSNGVLEYVPLPVLEGFLKEFRRIGSPRMITAHRLNLVDQFSYFDRSITPFNFLRYTAPQWRWRNSPLIWQNRLRISDYRRLFQQGGYDLVQEENSSGHPEDLRRVPLAPEFLGYSEPDLLVLHSFLVARPRNTGSDH